MLNLRKKISRRDAEINTRKERRVMMINELSQKVIGIAIELHKNLGPGLLESAYEAALIYDLRESGLEVKQQVAMPFIYKEIKQEIGYRIDILVENKILIE